MNVYKEFWGRENALPLPDELCCVLYMSWMKQDEHERWEDMKPQRGR